MRVSKRGVVEGRPEYEPTAESRIVVKALVANGLTYVQIAKYLRISKGTLQKHYKKELRDGFDYIYAAVTGKLVQKALTGDFKSMAFWLERKGGWRRTEAREISGPDGTPIDVRNLTTDQIVGLLAATDPTQPEAGPAGGVEAEASQREPDELV